MTRIKNSVSTIFVALIFFFYSEVIIVKLSIFVKDNERDLFLQKLNFPNFQITFQIILETSVIQKGTIRSIKNIAKSKLIY